MLVVRITPAAKVSHMFLLRLNNVLPILGHLDFHLQPKFVVRIPSKTMENYKPVQNLSIATSGTLEYYHSTYMTEQHWRIPSAYS